MMWVKSQTLLGRGEYTEAEAIYCKTFDPAYLPLGDNLRIEAQFYQNLGEDFAF